METTEGEGFEPPSPCGLPVFKCVETLPLCGGSSQCGLFSRGRAAEHPAHCRSDPAAPPRLIDSWIDKDADAIRLRTG